MIDKSNVKCMGCSACVNICPRSAITFTFENSFFYNPLVDYDKCVSCKKCIEVCPSINFDTRNFSNPISYAVYGKDVERKSSTSGAAFPIMAKYILSKGGYVCGVSWDKNWNTHHIIIDNENDLYKLRFSKYVQSNPENVFSEIKKLLEQGETVLFSGTPCQNAGLLNYLNKSYENLYTVDLLCHGVPSPKIWQDYLDTNCNKKLIKDICFRNKENGWVTCENCFLILIVHLLMNLVSKNQLVCFIKLLYHINFQMKLVWIVNLEKYLDLQILQLVIFGIMQNMIKS